MTTTDRKLRVFLCHSSQDKPIVRELYLRLLAEDWIDPWLDEEKLLPGQDWDLEIEKAVEAADAIIVCLSSTSVSKEGYVQKEIKAALNVALFMPEETIYIVPLRFDECSMPRNLRSIQYIDFFPIERKEWVYSRLFQSLKVRMEQVVKRKDEEQARKEKEEREREEAKEKARQESEERKQKEAEEDSRREADERNRKNIEAHEMKEVEEKTYVMLNERYEKTEEQTPQQAEENMSLGVGAQVDKKTTPALNKNILTALDIIVFGVTAFIVIATFLGGFSLFGPYGSPITIIFAGLYILGRGFLNNYLRK